MAEDQIWRKWADGSFGECRPGCEEPHTHFHFVDGMPRELRPSLAERAEGILRRAGFVPDGATREEVVRVGTSRSPVYGGVGGERRKVGGRARFALPGTEIRATVGPRTVYLYRRGGRDVAALGDGGYSTKDFTAGDPRRALEGAEAKP